MSIVISRKNLSNRGKQGQNLLKPISKSSTGPAYKQAGEGKDTKIFGFFDGSFAPEIPYRDWKFRTVVNRIYGMYFERWIPYEVGKDDNWQLDRAYLSLYELMNPVDSKELICLHCDPMDEHHYKRVPHIHVKASEEPIPHAHIALELYNNPNLLKSSDDLFAYFSKAIGLLKSEILDRM